MKFGVFQFPPTNYPFPLSSLLKMKGIEPGQYYYRHGTTNATATGIEVIRINEWLKTLPTDQTELTLTEEISKLLERLTLGKEKVSVVLADVLRVAKQFELKELTNYCCNELKGFDSNQANNNQEGLKYRAHTVIISLDKVEFNPYTRVPLSSIKNELENKKGFYKGPLLFSHSIISIEDTLERYKTKEGIGTITLSSKNVIPNYNGKEYPMYAYIFIDTYENLYRNIRQKAIDLLMSA